ncbi:MAG TPA: hypothetical protein VJ866_15395 [Pyrinomonadaceae bacterium]|nr:hypothetical protein [Pyrinomonadaceae bacterium]
MSYQTSRGLAGATGQARYAFASGKLYGLLELDSGGTVLYSRVEMDGSGAGLPAPDLTGLNFFTEVAPFQNVGDFQRQLDLFGRGQQPASSLDFVCQYDDGPLAVRVLLARIRECSDQHTTKSILVHIRRLK